MNTIKSISVEDIFTMEHYKIQLTTNEISCTPAFERQNV